MACLYCPSLCGCVVAVFKYAQTNLRVKYYNNWSKQATSEYTLNKIPALSLSSAMAELFPLILCLYACVLNSRAVSHYYQLL